MLRDWLTDAENEEYEDLYLRYAIAAARRALRDAGLPPDGKEIRRDIALVLGTCNGGLCFRRSRIRLETRAQFARL